MKRWSFKLLDGKWAEWEEQEAENRCDKGQQELQEQTILHVQNRGNITNQRATLGCDCVFFLIFHLRSGWRCRKPLCCTLTQVTDSCNDWVTQPERGARRGTATPILQWIFHRGCVLHFQIAPMFTATFESQRGCRRDEADLHLFIFFLVLRMRAITLYHPR